MGRMLIYAGIGLAVIGLFLEFGDKFIPLGRLPGDIHIEGEHGSFYFPVVTCIVISLVLNLLLRIFNK